MTNKEDNGTIRSFDTGATRDTAEGKLDMEGFTHPLVMKQFAKFMNMHRLQSNGELRDSDNWQRGIPKSVYSKSLRRHYDDFWQNDRVGYSENGVIADLCGIMFNTMGWMLEHLKERDFNLQDFDGDQPIPEIEKRKQDLNKKEEFINSTGDWGATCQRINRYVDTVETHNIADYQDEQCDGTCADAEPTGPDDDCCTDESCTCLQPCSFCGCQNEK